jgi:hypothetical protein
MRFTEFGKWLIVLTSIPADILIEGRPRWLAVMTRKSSWVFLNRDSSET